jgi:hypothetical protein
VTRTECDYCRTLGDAPAPPGWIIVAEQPEPCEEPGFLAALGHSHGADLAGTFCRWQCVAEYATARALVPAEDPEGSGT